MKSLEIALSGIFTALYAMGVIFLAPISFSVVQVRVIDCLIPLSAVFGYPMIAGVTAGNIIANFFGGLGVIDIVGGTLANLLASTLVYALSRREESLVKILLVNIIASAIITIIVGGYLSILFYVPLEYSILGVLIGSLISIAGLGTAVETILVKQNIRAAVVKT